MQKVLIKVRDKAILLQLKQFGDVSTVSSIFNVYSMILNKRQVTEVKSIDGVISVEMEKYFETQKSTLSYS